MAGRGRRAACAQALQHAARSAQYLLDVTTIASSDDYLRRGAAGYGYQLWLLPGGGRTFALAGRFGQWVFVDPASHLVMAQTAVEMKTGEDAPVSMTFDLWRALLAKSSVDRSSTP